MNLYPERVDEYPGAENFHVQACVAISESGQPRYVIGTSQLDALEARVDWQAYTSFATPLAGEFAQLIGDLIRVIEDRSLNIQPIRNPLDSEEGTAE